MRFLSAGGVVVKRKIMPLVIFLIIFLVLLAGVLIYASTGIPQTITAAQMREILVEKGFQPTNATDQAGKEMLEAVLTDCLIARQNDIRFEFYRFDQVRAALNVYQKAHTRIITTRMATPYIQIKNAKFNYTFYSLDADGTYSVTIYCKNTAIYAYCNSENKQLLNAILYKMGYII